jgi:hypothetical protein
MWKTTHGNAEKPLKPIKKPDLPDVLEPISLAMRLQEPEASA